eukprot:2838987-Rhodomonas_salina.1
MQDVLQETLKTMMQSNPATREEMIKNHMDKVKDLRKQGKAVQHLQYTHSYNKKPRDGSSNNSVSLKTELCPIAVSSLTLQTTHKV